MAYTGHYFKHASTSNFVTAIVEANNYFNMPSILWNANTCVVPLVKMSYHASYGIGLKDLSAAAGRRELPGPPRDGRVHGRVRARRGAAAGFA